jgi:probable rRNA maturation factor
MASGYLVEIQVRTGDEAALPVARLQQAVAWVLERYLAPPQSGVTVVLTGDDEVRALNRQYRATDTPTDVLSFPSGPGLGLEEDEAPYLGDLILGVPTIQRQADAEGHSLADGLVLAAVHGTLHLMGYDHDTASHQKAMWAVQAEALAALGVSVEVPAFEFDDEPDDGESATRTLMA